MPRGQRRYNVLWTYQEELQRLLDTMQIARTSRNIRLARAAVQTAYQKIPSKHRWKNFISQYTFSTEDAIDTGVIQYTASDKRVEFDGSFPLPSNVSEWEMQLTPHGKFNIAEQLSTTEIILKTGPAYDVTDGSYVLYKSYYPLPTNFNEHYRLFVWNRKRDIEHVSVHDIEGEDVFFNVPGTPVRFVVRNADEYYNTLNIQLSPPPRSRENYIYYYGRLPRRLVYEKFSQGTVTITSPSGTEIVFSEAVLQEDMVGSVIRFSGDPAQVPSGRDGDWAVGDNNGTSLIDNPFAVERIIASVDSSTVAQLDAPTGVSIVADTQYVITDPIDITNDALLQYLHRAVDYEYAVLSKRQDVSLYRQLEQEALVEAMAFDGRDRSYSHSGSGGFGGTSIPNHMRPWSMLAGDEYVP